MMFVYFFCANIVHFKDTVKFTQTIEKSITYFKHFYQTRTSVIYRIQQRNITELVILTLFFNEKSMR